MFTNSSIIHSIFFFLLLYSFFYSLLLLFIYFFYFALNKNTIHNARSTHATICYFLLFHSVCSRFGILYFLFYILYIHFISLGKLNSVKAFISLTKSFHSQTIFVCSLLHHLFDVQSS